MQIGILGGGQLGRMLALAGYPLGFRFRFLDPSPDACASHVGELIVGAYDDPDALEQFRQDLDVVTYEFENVPAAATQQLIDHIPVHPAPAALDVAQDRLTEKQFFRQHEIGTAPFAPVDSRDDLRAALDEIGLPAVLKTRREGYDGKGQVIIRAIDDAEAAWQQIGGVPLILEGFVPYERELSILAMRGLDGSFVCYPLVENVHRGGILYRSRAAAPELDPALQAAAETSARRVMDSLDYVGVLAIEFFQHEGRLLANEMAPRVHNSGHWSIEGAETSQFENHLRAVAGLPLGPTDVRGHAAMVNLIGATPERDDVLAIPGAHLHLYGKSARPGRKLGHVTLRDDDAESLAERLGELEALIEKSRVE